MNLKFTEKALPRALKCLSEEKKHDDRSFSQCLMQLFTWVTGYNGDTPCYNEDAYIKIYTDSCNEYSFGFTQYRADGSVGIVGGILFHGWPSEKDTSHAVCLTKPNAWMIHT